MSGLDDRDLAVLLYRRMAEVGSPTLDQAATSLGFTGEETDLAHKRLAQLGLLTHREGDPESIIRLGPEVALVRALSRAETDLGRYRDRLAETQERLEEIVGQFLPLGTGTHEPVELEVMTDLRRVAAYLESATNLAREEVLSMHPGPPLAAHLRREAQDRNRQLADRGLRRRTIYQRSVAALPHMAEHLRELSAMGYEIRVAQVVPVRLIIFDRRRAVIPLDPADGRAGALAIEGELFVRSLVAIHDYCWIQSSSFDQPVPHPTLSEQELTIVRMLATGLKDEKIARQLNVSLRTVSRTVSELMQRLNVESRFQAGVRAAQLGWID